MWYETTCEEICAFLALNVLFGIKTGSLPIWQMDICTRCKFTQARKMAASLNTALNIALFRTSLAISRGKIITYFMTIFSPLSDWLKICLPRICICVELRLRIKQISLLIWNQTSRKWKHFVTGNQFFGRKRTLWQLSGRTRSLFVLLVRSVMLEAMKPFAESRMMEGTSKFQRYLPLHFTTSTWGSRSQRPNAPVLRDLNTSK